MAADPLAVENLPPPASSCRTRQPRSTGRGAGSIATNSSPATSSSGEASATSVSSVQQKQEALPASMTEWEALSISPGVAVDDSDRASETALLHLYNSCAEAGAALLLVARNAPAAWQIALPDLASRLRAAPAIGVAPPDDALLSAVLVKHFADRQLRVQPAVIAYLVRRMERSFATAAALSARLDQLALAEGRPIGLALTRRVLAEFGA